MAMFQYILALILIILTTFFLFFKWRYGYWKRRNVAFIEPKIPIGNLENLLYPKRSFNEIFYDAYTKFKSDGRKFGGVFVLHKSALLMIDSELIQGILTTDFQYFRNHGNFVDEEIDPLSANLLNLEDDKWKNMRAKLSPTFTSGKMKTMFDAMLSCAEQLIEHINGLSSQKKPLDVKEVISCYSTDVIGTCAFGVECNSFKNPDAEFRKYGRQATELGFGFAIRTFILFVMPELNKILRIKVFPSDVVKFFSNAFESVVNQRIVTNSKRKDFIQLLLDLNETHKQASNSLSMNEMLAQAFIFFIAGFETTSTNISFCLYELALQPEIQQRVRDEIFETLELSDDGQLTYDGLMEMKYMDQVIEETLRKYPPIPFLNRKCSKEYKIPRTNVVIEEGTTVLISVYSLQMDEAYFPNPEKFDPERFSKENKPKIRPYTFLPFGDGPRICIGRRFAIMQIKIALYLILKNFKVLPHETTPKTIKFSIKNIGTMRPDRDILLDIEPFSL